jgi:hypothetical protein
MARTRGDAQVAGCAPHGLTHGAPGGTLAGMADPRAKGAIPCRATAKHTGKPCAKPAVPGALVCSSHGGKAQQVYEKAATRVDEATEAVRAQLMRLHGPAIEALREVLTDPGARASDRIKAAETVLDRTVGRKLEAAVDDRREERDLDAELDALLGGLAATGTDDAAPVAESLGDEPDDDTR